MNQNFELILSLYVTSSEKIELCAQCGAENRLTITGVDWTCAQTAVGKNPQLLADF